MVNKNIKYSKICISLGLSKFQASDFIITALLKYKNKRIILVCMYVNLVFELTDENKITNSEKMVIYVNCKALLSSKAPSRYIMFYFMFYNFLKVNK